MKVSKTENRFKTGFQQPKSGFPKRPGLTTLTETPRTKHRERNPENKTPRPKHRDRNTETETLRPKHRDRNMSETETCPRPKHQDRNTETETPRPKHRD